MPLDYASIRAFPKIELHVHVEACISVERLEQLAREAGVPMLRPREAFYRFESLAEFLELYDWWCDLLRTADIAEQVAYDAAKLLHEDGIVYAEVFAGPKYWSYVEYAPLIEALGRGYERAHKEGYTDCRILPAISREQSVEWAFELVEWIATERPARVVGLGLDGNEEQVGRTCEKFEGVFKRAAEIGLGRSCHSGESSGPEGVWDALNYLKVDRIDHGVRAIHDPELVKRLADDRVPLTVCPTSNLITGIFPSIAELPIGAFLEEGIPVTVNSDDPLAMGISLSSEILKVGENLGWSIEDVAAVTRNAIDAAFCGKDKAQELYRKVDEFIA